MHPRVACSSRAAAGASPRQHSGVLEAPRERAVTMGAMASAVVALLVTAVAGAPVTLTTKQLTDPGIQYSLVFASNMSSAVDSQQSSQATDAYVLACLRVNMGRWCVVCVWGGGGLGREGRCVPTLNVGLSVFVAAE